VWPRALSTFGRLNRLKSDNLEGARSSFEAFWLGKDSLRMDGVRPLEFDIRDSVSRRLVLDRPNRHREVEVDSCVWLCELLRAFIFSCGVSYVATNICDDDKAILVSLADQSSGKRRTARQRCWSRPVFGCGRDLVQRCADGRTAIRASNIRYGQGGLALRTRRTDSHRTETGGTLRVASRTVVRRTKTACGRCSERRGNECGNCK
jgi:hypothetical protein